MATRGKGADRRGDVSARALGLAHCPSPRHRGKPVVRLGRVDGLMAQGVPTAAGVGEEVVPATQYRPLESQVRELHRMVGKKTMENEILREAVTRAAGPKRLVLRSSSWLEIGQ